MNTNKQTNKNEIRKNIIELFEIEKLPEEKREEAITRIGNIIFQSVLIKSLPALNEKDLAEYEKMMDNHVDADILLDFFFEKVPNFLQIVVEESENFRKESAEVLEQTN
ncbi:MAG: hypothetical protein UR62_C0015G0027 [Candidatus Nomurabacteria bacterium GW2011_GWF2_35_12]|uniref:Uncharacterized protein n=2 Tax=Candidatus Nomuraibacteriota TaxID=1752729 RepID=A0A0G0H1D0_9BACT|nr:MAG: hypothetical protein UR62_C0015G0027 [Candidatus Nomurabacteria bacterium GW2011_GWF2_35_12]KKP72775.1 MAG: hypothetical protein UR70_C0004G0018 [Candidatus Nomurabacteria bacterium GW2011_GWB1_35_20]KKP75507.1 MAG: hypothetical protein UR72_C0005G0024 [Parcubacteria group bacterium GW2011_GWC1_35_21]KKP78052.1 MAG: hypothetical protein UR77_C0007G0006 [Candidatus Nomurabacteria bacterium GW2011_GWC2_35_35]KKP84944.1 MAG: hypothetical protein UR86_C0016G0011 [Parcubacteria group bacteri